MIVGSLLVGGALALRASAFLVVPQAFEEGEEPLPITHGVASLDAQTQVINYECRQCPFAQPRNSDRVTWAYAQDSSLTLNFTTDAGVLLLNDQQIFPTPPPPYHIKAIQHRPDGQESPALELGFALEVMPTPIPVEGAREELWSVRFTVLDIAGQFVTMDTVFVGMLKMESGDLYILQTGFERAPTPVPWKQCRKKPSCLGSLLMARIHSLLEGAKIRAHKASAYLPFGKGGCHGKHHGDGLPPPPDALDMTGSLDDTPPPPPHHGGHHGHGRPHHHHRPHMHGGWARAFSRAVRFILVPAALGVLAGLAASAVGMLVGQVVVFMWLRYRRATSRGISHAAIATEQGTDNEKAALMVDDELPPYSDEECAAESPEADKK